MTDARKTGIADVPPDSKTQVTIEHMIKVVDMTSGCATTGTDGQDSAQHLGRLNSRR